MSGVMGTIVPSISVAGGDKQLDHSRIIPSVK
jgi:hypothetical protein